MWNKGNMGKTAFFIFLMAISSLSFAQDKSSDQEANKPKKGSSTGQMSSELKKDMADMYQKMGDCMKTDKSMEQCQKDIMKDCPVVAKTGHCPLMEGMRPMMKKGMHHSMKNMNQE